MNLLNKHYKSLSVYHFHVVKKWMNKKLEEFVFVPSVVVSPLHEVQPAGTAVITSVGCQQLYLVLHQIKCCPLCNFRKPRNSLKLEIRKRTNFILEGMQ